MRDDLTEEDIQLLYALETKKLPERLMKATSLVIKILDENIDLYERIYEVRREEAVTNSVEAYLMSLIILLVKKYGIKPIAKAIAEMYNELIGNTEEIIANTIKRELDEFERLKNKK